MRLRGANSILLAEVPGQHTKLFRNHCGAEMKNEKADGY